MAEQQPINSPVNVTVIHKGCGSGCGSGCAWLVFLLLGIVVLGIYAPHLRKKSESPSREVSPAPTASPAPSSSNVVPEVPGKPAVQSQPQIVPTASDSLGAQKRAMAAFPALGVAGSPLNREFVARHKRYQTEKPDFFTDAEWPTKLAKECADALGAQAR